MADNSYVYKWFIITYKLSEINNVKNKWLLTGLSKDTIEKQLLKKRTRET